MYAWGPSIKYVTLFLANFDPPPPVTLCHISRDRQKYVTHLGPPIFSRPRTKNPYKSPPVQILSQLFAGVLSGGFVFCLEGFVRGCFLSVPLLSECICYNRKLNIT